MTGSVKWGSINRLQRLAVSTRGSRVIAAMSHSKRNSGQPKQKWTHEEEQALRIGVKSYGVGKWRLIQKDDACGPVLANRSNVDLKDKWRNLNMEAKEQGIVMIEADDDPDFKSEVNKRKRKMRRSSMGTPSSCHESAQVPICD